MILRLDGPDAEVALAELLSAAQYDRLRVHVARAAEAQNLLDDEQSYYADARREFAVLYDGIAPKAGV